jgi:hypothetical protein
LIGWFGSLGFGLERIGLEAGPLSQWAKRSVPTILLHGIGGGHGAKGAFAHPHMGICESSFLTGLD